MNFKKFDYFLLFKDPISKCSHIMKSWGLGLQHMNFEEPNSPHSILSLSISTINRDEQLMM